MNTSKTSAARQPAQLARLFSSTLQGFEIDAIRACRGFQVAMAVNVFGVGTLLPNHLAERGSVRPGVSGSIY